VANMSRASLIPLVFWVALGMACNLSSSGLGLSSSSGAVPTASPQTTVAPTSTNTPAATTAPTSTLTPTPAPTLTPSPPMVSPLNQDVACRFGPGTVYSIEGALVAGHTVLIQGRDSPGGWWYIENPGQPGRYCWVPSSDTQTQGDTSLVAVQPPPVAFVDYVGLDMTPSSKDIACGSLPYTFNVNFKIEWNGPITLTFQRIKSNGQAASPETYVFKASGTQTYTDSYQVNAAGTYWFKVQVTSPNSISAQNTARLTCH